MEVLPSKDYLSILQDYLKSNPDVKKTYILGNPSGDMDSVLCSYLLSLAFNLKRGFLKEDSTKEEKESVYIPILYFKKEEMKFKSEIVYVLEKFKIDYNKFYFFPNEEMTKESLEKNKSQIYLVDFSFLDEKTNYLADYVVGIYDHHLNRDFTKFINLSEIFLNVITASCTSIILNEHFMDNFPHDYLTPKLALIALLLDSKNFLKEYYQNRWTDKDKFIFDRISSFSKEQIDYSKYYKEVEDIKFDEKYFLKLGHDSLFEMDRKLFTWGKYSALYSSIRVTIDSMMNEFGKEKILDYMKGFKDKNFYLLQCDVVKNNFKELILYSYHFDLNLNSLKEILKARGMEPLKIEYYLENDKRWIQFHFKMTASRKNLEPIFKEYFSNLKE